MLLIVESLEESLEEPLDSTLDEVEVEVEDDFWFFLLPFFFGMWFVCGVVR